MKNAEVVKKIALFRIKRLFQLAEERIKDNNVDSEELSKRYLRIAMEISRHYKVSMPLGIRERICKKCGSLLTPGINCSVRSSGGFLIYKCTCGYITRRRYKRATSPQAVRAGSR